VSKLGLKEKEMNDISQRLCSWMLLFILYSNGMFKRQKLYKTKAEDSYIKNFTPTECLNGKKSKQHEPMNH
jgi:hypothetical protein